ncbi:MAG: hypothetical protein MUO67_04420 [Anaerolineales bacterium]|nr:hypothetical protein [Anaerolineales bacterium]
MFRKLASTLRSHTLLGGGTIPLLIQTAKLILVLLIVFSYAAPTNAASKPKQETFSAECQATLDILTSEEGWFERLIDPVITSNGQLLERRQLYTKVNACLQAEVGDLPDDLQMVKKLSEYFLIFAGGLETNDDESTLTIVDLASVDMEAVQLLKEKADIQPPEGYVFLRTYPSRSEMPELVRQAFQDEDVKGVTIFSRYIAILEEEKEILQERILQQQTLPETVTHELIHATINATLGYQNADSFPRWFHEGVAIYLSGSGEDRVVMLGDLTITKTSPEDYVQYDLNFKYLESEIGQDELLGLIGTAIKEINPSVMYEELGYENADELMAAAKSWRARAIRNRLIAGIIVAIFLFFGLWKVVAPEEKCPYCDYGGKRVEFEDGFCPQCGRMVEL